MSNNFPWSMSMYVPDDAASCAMSDLKDSVIEHTEKWDSSNDVDVDGSQGITNSNSNRSSSSSIRNNRRAQLHGRQQELAAMKKCFEDVQSGSGAARLLLVEGVSGSGKSTLVEHMRDFVVTAMPPSSFFSEQPQPQQQQQTKHGYFCVGKFEQSLLGGEAPATATATANTRTPTPPTTTEPFSALATAFSDVIDFILNDKENVQARSQAVADALGSDVAVLVDIVPNLSLLLGASAPPTRNLTPRRKEGASTKTCTNLALLFRNFLRSLTSKEHPILLFLDDLQFADDDSLDVFRALVRDSSLKHLLIVGSFRSNETSAAELLSLRHGSANAPRATAAMMMPSATIRLGDLDLAAINAGLAEKLRLDPETTEPLSRVVLHKSGGNPFYVTQYLTMLREQELLFYSEEMGRWTWDVQEIVMMTNISNNVLELVSRRLQRLPDKTIALLTLIAFVGFSFEIDFVEVILRQLAGLDSTRIRIPENQSLVDKVVSSLGDSTCTSENLVAIEAVLKEAMTDGLVEKGSDVVFKFTHDRIQQALYERVDAEMARSELHYNIGQAVSSNAASSGVEEGTMSSFFVADQLNRGIAHITEDAELIELATLNLKVGKKAAYRAGYQAAATYLRSAMKLVNEEKYWSTNYSLMIDLCSSKAEIEAKMSNFERSREICEVVLKHGVTVDDKLRAYVCLVGSYCTQEALDDAVRVGMEFLSQVGINLPKRPTRAHVMLNLIQTKKCMRKVDDSTILESPTMTDMRMAKAIEVLNKLATAYFIMASAGEMFVIIISRIIQLTRQFGIAETTAEGFAYFGLLNSSAGNRKQALRYGNLALALVQQQSTAPHSSANAHVESSVLAILHHFVMWWKIPVHESISPFLRGLLIGKKQGDLEWAYFCGNGLVSAMFHSGNDLFQTLDVTRDLCGEMIELEVHAPARGTMPYWCIVENLTGYSDNTFKLTGTAMNEDEWVQQAMESKNLVALETINSLRLCAAVIFQEWSLAAELAPLVVSGIKFLDAHFWAFTIRLYLGLTYSESYLSHGKRRDLSRLRKMIRELKHWESIGVKENCKPLHLILQAELAATANRGGSSSSSKKEKEMVPTPHDGTRATAAATEEVVLYEGAIAECRLQKLVHYQAIACERASRICQLHSDRLGAAKFLSDAEECYRDWGADAKVEQMRRKHFRPRS